MKWLNAFLLAAIVGCTPVPALAQDGSGPDNPPPPPTSDSVSNESSVPGTSVSDALDWLSTNGASVAWGGITGDITNQTDLMAYLTNVYTKAEIDAFGFLTTETDPIFTNWQATVWPAHTNDASAHHTRYTDGEALAATTNWVTNYLDVAGYATTNWVTNYLDVAGYATTNWMTNYLDVAGYVQFTDLFAGPGTTGLVTSTAGDTNNYLRGDGVWASFTELDPLWTNSSLNSATNWSDGLSVERQSLFITNVAGTVYAETELIGGGDMLYFFNGTIYTLDCTSGGGVGGRARSGALVSGTDTNPVLNYIYVVPGAGTTAILTNSTSIPTTDYAWVGRAYLKSAATTLADGPEFLQRASENISHDGRGGVAWERERIRTLYASYLTGVDFTVTDDAGGNITWANTAGIVYQLHRQTFPSFSDPAEIIIINDPTTPYRTITNFNQITEDATGTAWGNGRFLAVRIYGCAASGEDGVSRLYCTLPKGTYTSANVNGALGDGGNFDVNFLPAGLKGGGFTIARVVMQNNAGTYALVSGGDQDFRGFTINATSGGGSGSGISQVAYQDSLFNIYDDGNPARQIFFQASGLTTARTFTMQDRDGTVALLDDIANTGNWDTVYSWYTNNYLTNSTTVEFDQTVTFPSIIVAGQLIDGSVSTISVANVEFDTDWLPTASNSWDLGSAAFPLAAIYATEVFSASGTVWVGDVPIRSDGTNIIANVVNTNNDLYIATGDDAELNTLTLAEVTAAWKAGQLVYDPTEKTFYADTGYTNTRVNVGRELHTVFYNDTGATIENGRVLNQAGVTNGVLKGQYLDVLTPGQREVFIGVCTVEAGVPDGQLGLCTFFGDVSMNLTNFNNGGIIYAHTNGLLTQTKPLYPAKRWIVGSVQDNSTNGTLHVQAVDFTRKAAFKSYNFTSSSVGAGTYWKGGFYDFAAADWNASQASLTQTYGTAGRPYSAHAAIVAAGPGTVDTGQVGLRVVGTVVDDDGNYTPNSTNVITDDITALVADTYYEADKFVGQVTFELYTVSGAPTTYNVDVNYGFAKYEDVGNIDFTITDFEVVWRCAQADTAINVELMHHKATGWTYAATDFVPGNSFICSLTNDLQGAVNTASGEDYAYKRSNLSQFIDGNGTEGLIVKIVTGSGNSVQSMDIHGSGVSEELE